MQLAFSTLNQHRLEHQPHVTVDISPDQLIRVAFSTNRLEFNAPQVPYTLPFEPGFATFPQVPKSALERNRPGTTS